MGGGVCMHGCSACTHVYNYVCVHVHVHIHLIHIYPMQNPLPSRPPVTHYNVTHNVSEMNQLYTHYTNITIHGALPGHVYYIQVTPVNVLGPGTVRTTCEYICVQYSGYTQ